ncbi:MAG TPA: ATP-binding cassette domain-containing protein [Candidatus Saccharimonadales bacterium]|nr:ATP-binding cassette domain-containing protein [Candidatus Saccharimonadales bacterium]
MRHAVLSARQLSVRRSDAFTLTVPNLQFAAGSITCIAGPNGSGKSTLLHCLVGLLQPDVGTVSLQGQLITANLRVTKAALGYIPDDEEWLIKELTAQEYFALLDKIYAEVGVTGCLQRAHTLADTLRFTTFKQQLQYLSHGDKKKVQLIAGLMHRPAVIIIDELRNGLDPLAVIAAESLLQAEAKRGACIIAATHDLWWAQRVAKSVLLLIDGRVAVHDTTKRLLARHTSIEQLFLSLVQTTHA